MSSSANNFASACDEKGSHAHDTAKNRAHDGEVVADDVALALIILGEQALEVAQLLWQVGAEEGGLRVLSHPGNSTTASLSSTSMC